jgi:hypothetical protein
MPLVHCRLHVAYNKAIDMQRKWDGTSLTTGPLPNVLLLSVHRMQDISSGRQWISRHKMRLHHRNGNYWHGTMTKWDVKRKHKNGGLQCWGRRQYDSGIESRCSRDFPSSSRIEWFVKIYIRVIKETLNILMGRGSAFHPGFQAGTSRAEPPWQSRHIFSCRAVGLN